LKTRNSPIAAPISALVVLCAILGCGKNPAEQTASAQTPAAAPAQQPAEAPVPPKPMPAELPDVLARVNGQPVMRADFDRLIKNVETGRGPIPADKRDEVLRAALDQLIAYTVLKQEAAARKLTVPDTDVDAQVAQMQKQFGSEAEFQKALAARNTTVEQLKADAKADMAINKMMEAEVASAAAATDADAQDFYAKNQDKFKQGETVRASHILVKVEKTDDEAAKKEKRAKIDAVLKRAKAGEDFAALAKENSADGSAAQGGDLGFFPQGQMVPPFDQAAFALKPGEISDVVTTEFGYHIIKLTERKEASVVPLEQVKPRVLEYLTNQKKQDRANTFIDEAKKRAKIEVLV
jgi:peptidyl-prolyl cis-trans isomerase C